jgi:hypothetical protein
VCDDNYSAGLRCYYDPQYGIYSTGIADSCNYTYKWTGTGEKPADEAFQLFPNPAGTEVTVITRDMAGSQAILIDLQGKTIIQEEFNHEIRLNLESLPPGMYQVILIRNDKILGTRNLIKQ